MIPPWRAVRIAAAEALRGVLVPDDEVTITELVSSVKNDTEPIVKAYSAGTLLSIGNKMGLLALADNLGLRLWPREISHEFLREYSGEDLGFRPYASESERDPAVAAWKAWVRSHEPLHRNLVENLGVYKFLLAVSAQEQLVQLGLAAAPTVREGLSHANEHVRTHCAEVLGLIEDADAVDVLARTVLDDPKPMPRLQAAIALGRIGEPAAAEALRAASADSDVDVRAASIVALGKIGDPEILVAAEHNAGSPRLAELAHLFGLFGRASYERKQRHVRELGRLGNPLALPWLVLHRADLGDVTGTIGAIAEAGRLELPSPVGPDDPVAAWTTWLHRALLANPGPLRERLDDPKRLLQERGDDADVRRVATLVLSALTSLLDDATTTEHERFRVAELFGVIRHPSAVDPLAQLLVDDPSILVREAAAASMEKIADPAAAPALERGLSDPERYVRAASARALRTCGTPESRVAMTRAYEDNLTDSEILDLLRDAFAAIHDRASGGTGAPAGDEGESE